MKIRPTSSATRTTRRDSRGFTLVEILVVIGIIGLLTALLLPSLTKARRAAATVKCLSNMRQMQVAQVMYAGDNGGHLVRAGLAHGPIEHDQPIAWIHTLSKYYKIPLLHRCPADVSPHWPLEPDGGDNVPVPGTTGQYRRTSYGINDFLDPVHTTSVGQLYTKMTQVRRSSATIQFVEMVETGTFAGADHPHVPTWYFHASPDLSPALAGGQLQTARHGGKARTWSAIANYGFLDGHAETRAFRDVYRSPADNNFDPAVAK